MKTNLKGNQTQSITNLKGNQSQSITNLKGNQSQAVNNRKADLNSLDRTSLSQMGVASREFQISSQKEAISNKKGISGSNRTGRTIINERLTIQWIFPIEQLLEMEITHQLNEHGKLQIKALLPEDVQIESLSTAYQEHEIQIFDIIDESLPVTLFYGKVEKVTYEYRDYVLVACIQGISYSIDLEQEKKYRSFQDISLSFEQVIDEVTRGVGARFLWHMDRNRSIERPYFQYEESDWSFCKRLASRFNCPIVADITTGRPDIHFGIQSGMERNINDGEALEAGFSSDFYTEGGYHKGKQRGSYSYLKFKHDRLWQIGDTLRYRNQVLMVYERSIQYTKGELVYVSTLGGTGLQWQKPIYNDALQGLKLQGIIRKVEEESVYVQFFFDSEEKADYPWPWVPEVGNLSYIMPEVDSLVTLSFSSDDEKDGLATHLIRTNSGSSVYQREPNREFITVHDKMLGLHPEQMVIRGEGQSASIVMDDDEGIALRTPHGIRLNAGGNISISGGQLTVTASEQILMQNSQSNIELCKTFNLFAPSGVNSRTGAAAGVPPRRPASKGHPSNLQFSSRALGAIPQLATKDAVSEQAHSIVNMMSRAVLGAIPAVATAPMISAVSQAMSGRNVESRTMAKTLSTSGSFTNNGGFFIPKT